MGKTFAVIRLNADEVAGTEPAAYTAAAMTSHKISERERARRACQRALSIEEFCDHYGVGRTTAYAEIKARRLPARKIGRRTLVTVDEAEDWLRRLPLVVA